MVTEAEEEEDGDGGLPGHLDGRFVEFHDVGWAADALDFQLSPIGELVEPDGRCGVARWLPEAEEYVVETTDGLVLQASERQLREAEPPDPSAGGSDLVWPTVPIARVGSTFALRVAQKLRAKGYCVIDMPSQREESDLSGQMKALPKRRTDWTLPHEEFEEIYLGKDHGSKVAWMRTDDLLSMPLLGYWRHMLDLTDALLPWTEPLLCFRASGTPACPLLRVPMNGPEAPASIPGPVAPEDVESGLVEKHLDFVQRRRICMMYFVLSGGNVELRPRDPESALPVLEVTPRADRLLLFRHDLFSYHCNLGLGSNCSAAVSSVNVVLQSWLLEEPSVLEIESIEGSQRRLQALLGGPKLPLAKQVHVMACNCKFPGSTNGFEQDWLTYLAQTDAFVVIPAVRFDIDIYYDDGSGGQFNANGKSSTKHCGMIDDLELMSFDNELFDVPGSVAALIPPIHRVLMETSYGLLVGAGFDRRSLRGAKMYLAIADIGVEWDPYEGLRNDPASWLSGGMFNLGINRLCNTFEISGPCHQVDTACSASLVAANMCHAYLRKHDVKDCKMGMSMGAQHILHPWPLIGLSAAGMLGAGGRCKTFDASANGYNRGEGCGGLFQKVSDEVDVITERLACYVSSYINQDGRSASLTAPNGPSQQAVARGSLKQGEIQPEWVVCTENHGTGTALGDPIECGTIASVFRKRETVLGVTSGKSHMGHLECGAGSIGILKTIASLVHGGVPANCHVRQPSAHCVHEGFPGIFPIELLDVGTEYHYGGCNGFGFGGTNTRADFWALRRNNVHTYKDGRRELRLTKGFSWGDFHGIRPLMPRIENLDFVTVACARCLGPMCWLCGLAPPEHAPARKHRCADVREDGASYLHCSRCYEGRFLHGGEEGEEGGGANGRAPEQTLHLWGSWNAWTALVDMSPAPGGAEHDAWEAEVAVGDTLVEHFCVVARSGRRRQFIHPAVKKAGQRVRALGPTDKNAGMHWLLDGHRDGVKEGTVYVVRFEWGGSGMAVSWRLAKEPGSSLPVVKPRTFQHSYFIVNSLSGWRPASLTHDEQDPCLWRGYASRFPENGRVDLMFMRDADQSQMIYPMTSAKEEAKADPEDPQSYLWPEDTVPLAGPDEGGDGKRWVAFGKPGERLKYFLRVQDGKIQLSLVTESGAWRSWRGSTGNSYYLAGSWSRWAPAAMQKDGGPSDRWRATFAVGGEGREEFQILVNQNWNLRLYPAGAGSAPGESAVLGPDRKGNRKNWQVLAPPGAEMEVILDLDAEDYRAMVTCFPRSLLRDGVT